MKDIVFICGAKDFHAMDKFRTTSRAVENRRVLVLTDTIEGEEQDNLIVEGDIVHHLFIIDRFTFKTQSSFGNIWRNLLKIFFIPIQVYRLKKFYKQHPDFFYHAVPMYYMLLCFLAKVPFVGTPQGSEILVRPHRSSFYKKYAVKSLRAAKHIIVDSVNMQTKVKELSGVDAEIFKNGFNTRHAQSAAQPYNHRKRILSMRGMVPVYQIDKLLEARLSLSERISLTLVYPSCENDYKSKLNKFIDPTDQDLGKLSKDKLYPVMGETLLAISIPYSDSSPRSVYECIFAGACVAATYSPYIDELPECMRKRLFLVDLEDKEWLTKALFFAKETVKKNFIPSEEALKMCDEDLTIQEIIKKIYLQ